MTRTLKDNGSAAYLIGSLQVGHDQLDLVGSEEKAQVRSMKPDAQLVFGLVKISF